MTRAAAAALALVACRGIEAGGSPPQGPVKEEPAFACEPASLDFGAQLAGTTTSLKVRCRNTGAASPLELLLELPFRSGTTQPVGDIREITIPVSFEPESPGAFEGDLVLRSRGLGVGSVRLSGVALGALLVAEPELLDLGDVRRGRQARRSLTLRNLGTAELPITIGAPSNRAFSAAPAGPRTLPAGGSLALEVGYTPGLPESDEGSLRVRPSLGPAVDVALRGAARPDPACAFEPFPRDALSFGARPVGSAATLEVVVVSRSPEPCAVLPGARVEGGSSFVTPRTSGALLPSSGGTIFPVRFRPVVDGLHEGELVLPTESGELRLPLRGTGLDTCLTLRPDPLDLGVVPQGCGSEPGRLLVENRCGAEVALLSIGPVPSPWEELSPQILPLPLLIPEDGTLEISVTHRSRRASLDVYGGLVLGTDLAPEPLLAPVHVSAPEPAGECP